MRTEWVMCSAAMLVLGGFSVMFGFGFLPLTGDQGLEEALLVAARTPGRWLASCALIFLGSIALTMGVLAPVSLMRRDRRLAMVAAGFFVTGTVAMCGYVTVLAFLRGLMLRDQLNPTALAEIAQDPDLVVFALAWQGCLLVGLFLIAVGMFRVPATTPRWIPVLLVMFVVGQFVPVDATQLIPLTQWALLAVACVGAARAARVDARSRHIETMLAGPDPDATP